MSGDIEIHTWRNQQGRLHRLDGPAFIQGNIQIWHLDGKRHRLDGPAFVCPDGDGYYLDGKGLTQEEWAADPLVIQYHSQTQEGSESWLKQL